MRILLLGEYSKLHNSLKTGLQELGHEVVLAGTGDKFKKFPVDGSYAAKWVNRFSLLRWFNKVSLKLFHLSLEELERGIRFYFLLPQLKNFDQVQLINSNAIETFPSWSLYLLRKLFKQNEKIVLLICGDETPVTEYLLQKKMRYSVLTPYFENEALKPRFRYVLKYVQKNYKRLFTWVYQHSAHCITSDLDYHLPIQAMGYTNTFIPNPVIVPQAFSSIPPITDKIYIFLGINRSSALKKGIPLFKEALKIIKGRYPQKVVIQETENLPYETYIKAYEKAHIVLDMVYAYDQGYNALEAMARGKVVFTGAEKEFLQHYQLKEDEVCINALPQVDYLVKKIAELIETPQKIAVIGQNARQFVLREHNYKQIAARYVACWQAKEGI